MNKYEENHSKSKIPKYWINRAQFRLSDLDLMGETVFLSYEEVEKAIEERKKQNNGSF